MRHVKQINLTLSPEFERDLELYMRKHKLATESEAIRRAIHEALSEPATGKSLDFRDLLGIGNKAPQVKNPRFRTSADLW